MTADDEYYYEIKFYTNKKADNKGEYYYSVENLSLLTDLLKTGVKQ